MEKTIPHLWFNPLVSFIVNFDPSRDGKARENLDALWKKLSQGGTARMPLDKYPVSERYGWIQEASDDLSPQYIVVWRALKSTKVFPSRDWRKTLLRSCRFRPLGNDYQMQAVIS